MTLDRHAFEFRVIPFLALLMLALALAAGEPGAAAAPGDRWIPFGADPASAPPAVTLGRADSTAIEIAVDVPGVLAAREQTAAGAFTRLSGDGFAHGTQYGMPDLPVVRRDVEVPFGAQVTLEVAHAEAKDVSLPGLGFSDPILPMQPSQPKCGDGPTFVQSKLAPGATFPTTPAAVTGEYVVRGHRIVTVEVWPVAYDSARGVLQAYAHVDLRIRLSGADMARTRAQAERYASPAFDPELARRVLNFDQGSPARPATVMGYIIVSADAYYDAMAPFAALKQNQGFQVTHVRLSEIPGGTANTNIKAYIQNAYNTWPTPPSYVLLVGDVADGADTMPTWTGPEIGTSTDLYYATMDGTGDWVPDIHRGRLPARTLDQLNIMVQKNVEYAAATGAEPWVKKIAWLATCDQYTVAEGTHNYVIDNYTAALGYTGIFPNNPMPGGDRLYCITHNATAANVTTSVNDDRAMVIYSGHGSYSGWEFFSQSNVQALAAHGVYPFVASHACISGDFGQTEVYGETWMVQANKGALVYYGSSTNSLWDEDDELERRYFDDLYDPAPGQPSVSAMSYAGLAGVQIAYPGNAQYYWETYNILGDPSVEILLEPREPDFTLAADPDHVALCGAGQVTSTLTIGSLNAYTNSVTLAAQNVPAGVTVTFGTNPVMPPGGSVLTLDIGGAAAAGDYDVDVVGTTATRTHTTTVGLTIYGGVAGAPTLTAPANGAMNVSRTPTFEWTPGAGAGTYHLQVATDSGFANLVVDQAGLTAASLVSPVTLNTSTTYFWRVTTENTCGSATSTTFAFTTIPGPGDCNVGQVPVTAFLDTMENGVNGWTHSGTGDTWVQSTAKSHSPTHSWFALDPSSNSDQRLVSPAVALPASATPLSLKFWHDRDIEESSSGCYDGGILEISTNAGSTWTQMVSQILTDPYDGAVSTCCGNPLQGLQAWCGTQSWTEVIVDMSAFAGQTVQWRYRLGSDSSASAAGWYVDDVQVQACGALGNELYLPLVQHNAVGR